MGRRKLATFAMAFNELSGNFLDIYNKRGANGNDVSEVDSEAVKKTSKGHQVQTGRAPDLRDAIA